MAPQKASIPDPPSSLEAKHAQELSALTEAALSRQRCELARSLEAALGHIPRPLRGAVRRVLGL
jgi:hypothetical protein